ncbi:retrovirus-related pol polyprotein from transposon TNT 1-94 [Tanacetum coccineum]
MDEIETINIELEHSVAKLFSEKELLHKEIEHLKKIYKDQFYSIKKTRVLSKEHCKNVLDNATTITNATTISPGMFNLDLDPLAPRLLKNRNAHINYLKYTQEQVDILQRIVKQAKAKKPLDNTLDFAFKKVRSSKPLTSSSNIHKQVESSKTPDSNTLVLHSIGLKSYTSASRSQPTGNKKNDRISQTPSSNMKNKVEVQLRRANLSSNKKNHVKDPICDANDKHTMLNANSELIYVKCKQCMFDTNHDVCFLDFVNDVNVRSKSKSAKQSKQYNIWKLTGKVFTEIGYNWKPTGKLFTLVGNSYPLTRITSTKVVPLKGTTTHSIETQKPELKVYSRKPKQEKSVGLSKKSKIIESRIANNSEPNHPWESNAIDVPSSSSLDSGCSIHMTGNCSQLMNFVNKFLRTDRFRNDQISKIMGYGDYQLRDVTILRVYYVEGLEHNFVDLLLGSRDTNLYTISLDNLLKTSLICLLSKASKTKSLMRVESINGKKYILVIVDDYSRFTWVKFLRSKDEAPDTIIKCIKNIQVRLNAIVRNVRTDNGTEFVNQMLREFYENLMHDKKLDLSFLHVFGSLCYPTNDSEDLGKLNTKADIGLVPNPVPQHPFTSPTRNDWDHLFQPMFDEYFNPPPSVISPVQVADTLRDVDIADSPVSTSIDQNAPSTSILSTQEQKQSPIISQGVEESPKTPHIHDNLLHEDSTSQ